MLNTGDPLKENNWGVLEAFFYWYYDDNARQQFIRNFAAPDQANAMIKVYSPRKKFIHFFNSRISEFQRADLIERIYAQVKSQPGLRPVSGPLRIAYSDHILTRGYDFSAGRLLVENLDLKMVIRNADGHRQGFPFGWSTDKFANARRNHEISRTGVAMTREAAQALVARLAQASGEDQANSVFQSNPPFYAGIFLSLSEDRRTATLNKVAMFEDARLARPIPELNGAEFWINTAAQRLAEQQQEKARQAKQEEVRRQEEAVRQAAEAQETAQLAADTRARNDLIATDRAAYPLAVLGIEIGMTEAEARASLANANPGFGANLSRTGFERKLTGNIKNRHEVAECPVQLETIERSFIEFRYPIVGDDLADAWFLPKLDPADEGKLREKALELSDTLSPACRLRHAPLALSFETYTNYRNDTIRDAVRVYLGQEGERKGRVTAVLRTLVHRDGQVDLFGRAEEAYGAPNVTEDDVKYWLASPNAASAKKGEPRPETLTSCIGSGDRYAGAAPDLMDGTGIDSRQPYGAPSLVVPKLDLIKRLAQSCGTVLGMLDFRSQVTYVLLLDTDHVTAGREARSKARETAPASDAEPEIKF